MTLVEFIDPDAVLSHLQSDDIPNDAFRDAQPGVILIGAKCEKPIQTARQIRSLLPDIPFVFLVGDGDSQLVRDLRSPASGLSKPWEMLELNVAQLPKRLAASLSSILKKRKYRDTLSNVNRTLEKADRRAVSDLQRFSVSIRYLSQIVEHAHDGIMATTRDGIVVKWNLAAQKILNLSVEQVVGRSLFDIVDQHWSTQLKRFYHELIHSGVASSEHEIELTLDGNQSRVLELTLSLIRDDGTSPLGIVVFARDITERKTTENVLEAMRKDLERMSFEDGLTGIANRRMFDLVLDKEWHRMLRSQHPLSLIMIDIDYFKAFNDCYGHLAGDECLKTVAQVLKRQIARSSDLVARYGGEEFVILLPETPEEDVCLLAQRCCEAIRAEKIPNEKSKVSAYVTISAGVCCMIPHSDDASQALLNGADIRLYNAKRLGRNRVEND